MSIYSELSAMFKLAEKLDELREYPDDEDKEDIEEFASKFFDGCMTILSITANTEDEEFMRQSFLNSHYNLLDWIKNNYCSKNKQNLLENLLCNIGKKNLDNIYMNDDINLKKEEKNYEFNDLEEKEENIEIQKDSKISDDIYNTINLINNNYQKNYDNSKDINKKINSDLDYNSSTNISNPSKIIQNKNIKNNNINNENNDKEDEYFEEEEEEEEDDNNEIEEQKQLNIKEDKNEIINDEENKEIFENNLMNENYEIIYNDNEEKIFTNEEVVKEENFDKEEEENDNINEGEEESNDENKIFEKENKLNEITSKSIIEYFQLFKYENNENENFNNIYMTVKDLIKYYDKFTNKIKEKLLTFICVIFPFCSYNQKENLSIININNENIKVYLFKTLLYFEDFEENKKLYDLLSSIPSKKVKNPNFKKDLTIKSESELIILYTILTIFKYLNSREEKIDKISTEKIDFLSFKIYFILSHQGLYPCISENISNIFERLLFIKNFYSKAFSMKLEEPYITLQINQLKDEYNKLSLEQIRDKLFDEDERNIYNQVIKSVNHFYEINDITESDLLYYSNNKIFDNYKIEYNFLTNIYEMIYQKYNLIKNNSLKNTLNCLEKNIIDITKKLKRYNNDKSQYDSYYSFSDKLKRVFNEIISKIKNALKKELKDDIIKQIKFYPIAFSLPFICYTKFENDLNIYMDILKLNNMNKREVVKKISEYLLNKEFKFKKRDNTKYFKIVFEYKEINIKLLVLRQTLYIKSIILREYSLLDQRFPVLMLTLNYFLKKIGLYEKSKKYVGFLHYLLIAFLQDIINPPILPKLLSKDMINVQSVLLGYESNEEKKNFVNYEPMHIPKIIFNREKITKIYDEEIGENKNILTCSEIFLLFLEFFIYFYKFDSIYTTLSLNFEGIDSINNISNIIDDEEEEENIFKNHKNPNDSYFFKTFNKFYSKNKHDNMILMREPANLGYNIGPLIWLDFKDFYQKIKKGYEILIVSGSFDDLDKLNKKNKK